MRITHIVIIGSMLGLSAASAFAQPGAGPGPRGGPDATAPGMGMGPGGQRGAARWGSDYTPGWTMMTRQERDEHRDRMRSMQTYEECKSYQQQHHDQMSARAQERGAKPLAAPRRDACAGLKR